MSDDLGGLRSEIKTAALNAIARKWREGDERVATIERGLAYAEQIADAILDGGIEVRPNTYIMAVEQIRSIHAAVDLCGGGAAYRQATDDQPLGMTT